MTLLFLDFDGVLHPLHCAAERHLCHREQLEVWLRQRPGVDVVISSTWRELHSLEDLRSLFSADIGPRIVGTTPVMREIAWAEHGSEPPPTRFERQLEIEYWLKASDEPWRPWAALDDAPWLFRPFCSRLVLCDGAVGLDDAALSRADRVLGTPRP